jgi:2-polyprenyl-3-methyl-5-hydroxy-6-metoxy-1,4-benzoquinol methylase
MKKSKKEIESFYSSEYRKIPSLPKLSAEEHFHNKVIQNDANNRILFITNYMNITDKRILEIGSASGRMLQKLLEYGCKEAIGIELTEEFAEYSRQRGFKVFTRPIEELNFREEFDGVVSFFTLEHMYDPMEGRFNKIFERGVNSELMGNCLRFVAFKSGSGSGI